MTEELPPIGETPANPIKIKGLEMYMDSSDEVFKVPECITTTLQKTLPLSALRAAVAAHLHMREDDVSFANEGKTLDIAKTIHENNVLEPGPIARKKGQKIDIIVFLSAGPGALLREQNAEQEEAEKNRREAEEQRIRAEESRIKAEEAHRLLRQDKEQIWSAMMRMEDETTALDETLWDLAYREIALDELKRKFGTWANVGFGSYEAMYVSVTEGVAHYVPGKGRRGAIVRGVDKATAEEICGKFQRYKLACTTEMDEPGGAAAKRVRQAGKGKHWNPPTPREAEVTSDVKLTLTVKRRKVLSTAMPQILKADPRQLWPGAIKVKYEEEAGEGKGVNREFVTNICSRLVAPEFCLLLPAACERYCLNPLLDLCREAGLPESGDDAEDDLKCSSTQDLCRFFGRMLGMAFMHDAPLGALFIPSLYKQLLRDDPTFADLRYVLADDSGTGWYFCISNFLAHRVGDGYLGLDSGASSFLQRTASTAINSSSLTCEVTSASEQALESLSKVLGKTKDALREELGRKLTADQREGFDQTSSAIEGEGMGPTDDGPADLTSANIVNFSQCVVQKVLIDNLRPNLDLILEEFHKVVPASHLESLSWTMLETRIGGRLMTRERIREWKDRTVLKDYDSSSQVVSWWWEYVEECCNGDGRAVKKLFSWCTGFSGAMPVSWRFQIWKSADTTRHPAVNTCMTTSTGAGNTGNPMPTLYLPPYDSKEELIEKLKTCQLVKSFDLV